MRSFRYRPFLGLCVAVLSAPFVGYAQCPPTQLNNHNGPLMKEIPTFLANEQMGAVFTAPAGDYPIEILKIGIGWGSQTNANPVSTELGIHLYPAGLPNPGVAQFSIPGPMLTDGIINVWDISGMLGNKTISSGPFTVALELLNQSSGNPMASSVVHDNNGCTGGGQNVVFVIPGGWSDACILGVPGDWVMFVEYKCVGSVPTDDRTWGEVKTLYSGSLPR